MQVIIPASGLGTRFSNAGFINPKPFIDVFGVPMIERVMQNIGWDNDFFLIFRKEHKSYVDSWMRKGVRVNNIQLCYVDKTTGGAAETVYMVKDLVRYGEPVIVANSDQLVLGFDLKKFSDSFLSQDATVAGGILTFTPKPHDPKWSYVVKDGKGSVVSVIEKQVVSNVATIGIYGWSDSFFLFDSIKQMMDKGIRTNNEYYLAPSYNQLLECGLKIITYHIDRDASIGIGTPEDLQSYLEHHK